MDADRNDMETKEHHFLCLNLNTPVYKFTRLIKNPNTQEPQNPPII